MVRHPTLSPDEILRLKEWAFMTDYYRPAWLGKFVVRAARDLFT